MKLIISLPWLLTIACAEGASSTPSERSRRVDDSESDDRGGIAVVDASTSRRAPPADSASQQPRDAGQTSGGARAVDAGRAERARDAGTDTKAPRESDAGASKDAGQVADPDADQDAGKPPSSEPANTGSCCSASDAPGCGDSALQACVCALSPRCCSDSWDESCARLVKEKNCQSGVRDCVCGSAEGQWQQAYCCEGGWNATCESVSIHKCGATAACP